MVDGGVLVEDEYVGLVFADGFRGIVRSPRLGDDDVTRLAEKETNQATFERASVCDDGARLRGCSPHAHLFNDRPCSCIAHHGHVYSYLTGLVLSADPGSPVGKSRVGGGGLSRGCRAPDRSRR
jgi:hypothetical protein